ANTPTNSPTPLPCNLTSPGNLSVTASLNEEIDLAWTPGSVSCPDTIKYNIWRSNVSSSGPWIPIKQGLSSTTLSYQDTAGLINGTTYYYLISTVDTFTGSDTYYLGAPTGPVQGTPVGIMNPVH